MLHLGLIGAVRTGLNLNSQILKIYMKFIFLVLPQVRFYSS